ncbi:DUF6126 family protein [Streptomyces sp. NPDC046887]|uniref:DUF6126 family protein n=1 Tax=Streptomyces sp. NPDC046887 TaxID=3155472 RepID=UPI0033C8D36C
MIQEPAADRGETSGTPAPAPGRAGKDSRADREERRFPTGILVRLFAYLIAGHLFAAFLYLLFVLGGQNQ